MDKIITDKSGIKFQVVRLTLGTVVQHNGIYGHLTGFAYNAFGDIMIVANIPTIDYSIFDPSELDLYPL